jgi:hypothetical protein
VLGERTHDRKIGSVQQHVLEQDVVELQSFCYMPSPSQLLLFALRAHQPTPTPNQQAAANLPTYLTNDAAKQAANRSTITLQSYNEICRSSTRATATAHHNLFTNQPTNK